MPNILPPFKLNYDYLDSLLEEKKYESYIPTKIPNRRFENIQVSSDRKVYQLKDKNQFDVVSFIFLEQVEYNGRNFHEVRWTKSLKPRRKFLSYLFELLIIEFEFLIISDKNHTSPGSKEYWLSLGRKKKYDLFIYNTDNNYKRRYKNVSEDKIWGLKKEYLDEINSVFFEFQEINFYDSEDYNDEVYEFEGFEETDFAVLNSNVATKEIFKFVSKHKENIEDRENIRLIAQKS